MSEMQQPEPSERRAGTGLASALSLLILIGAAAVLANATNGRGHRAAGLMPVVVCTADRPYMITTEIVVRAPRPDHLAGAVASQSGINK